jgi:glutathione synthase/RimK-type ligase-like ATP-grasp enzyme
MVNVLIPTKPDDGHALYVKLALEKKGHQATLWYTADYPELQKHSFRLKNKEIEWVANGLEFTIASNQQFDVVWFRRPQRPMVPTYIHLDDQENAKRENSEFFKYFWQVITPDAYWINSVNNAMSANCKLRQLKAAVEVGFLIPDTLMSNDPVEIRAFNAKYADNVIIYKPVCPVYWVGEDVLSLTYTKEISQSLLSSDLVLQATPGIYQPKIPKKYELRITFMGEHAIAAKLDSQAHPLAKTDWRSVPYFEIEIEEDTLPEKVRQRCIALMKKLGVVFGCFDFIVTPENEYYFLEINEQGQFLWIEEKNPHIKMLDAFTNYLIQCGGGKVRHDAEIVSMADFNDSVDILQKHAVQHHKDVGLFT